MNIQGLHLATSAGRRISFSPIQAWPAALFAVLGKKMNNYQSAAVHSHGPAQFSATKPHAKRYRGKERLPVKVKDHFKASFIAYSRRLISSPVYQRLSGSQRWVVDWAHALTIAFQREWGAVNAKGLESDVYCRSSIYAARNELVKLGFLEFRDDAEGQLWVRLSPRFHCLSPELLAALISPTWPGQEIQKTGQHCPENWTETGPQKSAEPKQDKGFKAPSAAPIEEPIKKNPLSTKQTPTLPLTHARERAHDDAIGAIAKEDDATPPQTPVTGVDEAEPEASAPPTETSLPASSNVTDWEPDEDCPDQSDTVAAPVAPQSTAEQQTADCEAREVPPGGAAGPSGPGVATTDAGSTPEPSPAPSARLAENVMISDQIDHQADAKAHVLQQLSERLRARGVWPKLISKILRKRTPEEIEQGFAELGNQSETVDNPAGWLYTHLVLLWDEIQQAKADEAAAPQKMPTEAEAARAKERRAMIAAPVSSAERDRLRAERLQREADREEIERQERDAVLAREMAQGLGSLSPEDYAALRARAVASYGKRGPGMVEGIIKGQMLCLFEADQRQAQLAATG
jgi:hypothetical protein